MNDRRLAPPSGPKANPQGLRPQGGGPRPDESVNVSEHVQWIESLKPNEHLAQLGTAALVEHADKLGQALSRTLATSQIRRLLSRVNALSVRFAHQFEPSEIPLLKVQLAYAAARQQKAVGPLAQVLMPAVDRIHDEADFRWFAKFVEAIVAYHRYHGGRD